MLLIMGKHLVCSCTILSENFLAAFHSKEFKLHKCRLNCVDGYCVFVHMYAYFGQKIELLWWILPSFLDLNEQYVCVPVAVLCPEAGIHIIISIHVRMSELLGYFILSLLALFSLYLFLSLHVPPCLPPSFPPSIYLLLSWFQEQY